MKELLGMTIGLAKAAFQNEKTDHTDFILLKVLMAISDEKQQSAQEIECLKKEVKLEKAAVAPGCQGCMSRCGNTDDYDLNKIEEAPEEIKELKKHILEGITKKAELAYQMKQEGTLEEETMSYFYKALYVISEDWMEQLMEYAKSSEEFL